MSKLLLTATAWSAVNSDSHTWSGVAADGEEHVGVTSFNTLVAMLGLTIRQGDVLEVKIVKVKPEKLTVAQRRVLANLVAGQDPWSHIYGQAAHGGAHGTEIALFRKGLVTRGPDRRGPLEITEAGRVAFAL